MLHMFHMTNYTIQKEEGVLLIRVGRKARRKKMKNNNEEGGSFGI